MFELGGLPADVAVQALRQASYKFAIKTKVVARHESVTGEVG
jgi:large subunit ribosomal protein L16